MHDQRNVLYENRKMLLCFIRVLNEATTVKNLTKSTDANYWYVHGMLFIFETNFTRYSHQMLFKYLWQYSTEPRLRTKKKSAFESSNQHSARESFETVQLITCIREKCRVVVNNLCLVVDPYRDKIVSYLIVQEITWRQYTCVV